MARKVLNFPERYDGTLFEHADGTPRRSWLWMEWYIPGGIKRLIEDWQNGILREYPPAGGWGPIAVSIDPEVENDVLNHMHKEALALRKYHNGKYRDLLTPLERKLLSLETECLRINPHLHGVDVWRWVAEQLNGLNWGPQMVRDALRQISEVLVAYYDFEMRQKMKSTLLEFRKVYREVITEQQEVRRVA